MSFQPHSVLFDKGVIRRMYKRRVRLVLGEPPTLSQAEAASVYAQMCTRTSRLYITQQTAHILHRVRPCLPLPCWPRPPRAERPFLGAGLDACES